MIAALGGSAYTLAVAPLLPWWAIAALGGAAVLALGLGLWRRARGTAWRALALAMLLAILVNPSLVEEKRSALRDVAVIVVDDSPSQQIGDRRKATEAAVKELQERLGHTRDLDVRVIPAGKAQPGSGDDGTRLFTALTRAMSDVPRQRLAAVFMVTDGQVHDLPAGAAEAAAQELGTPLHVLLSGHPDERDRRLVVAQAPSFGLVGKETPLTIRVEDLPASKQVPAGVQCRIVPAHDEADRVAALMLARALPGRVSDIDAQDDCRTIVVSAAPPQAASHAAFVSRQLRGKAPGARIIVALWAAEGDLARPRERLRQLGVDAVVARVADAIKEVQKDPTRIGANDDLGRSAGQSAREG